MTRPELIEVLSFVPGFTTDMLSGLPSERLVELYSDYFEGQDMSEISTAVFLGLIIGTVTGTSTVLIIYWLASLILKD